MNMMYLFYMKLYFKYIVYGSLHPKLCCNLYQTNKQQNFSGKEHHDRINSMSHLYQTNKQKKSCSLYILQSFIHITY